MAAFDSLLHQLAIAMRKDDLNINLFFLAQAEMDNRLLAGTPSITNGDFPAAWKDERG